MLAIYTRLSKEDEESNSIENQLREAKQFAKSNGHSKYEIYNEGEGVSGGAEIAFRPELERMLKDMAEGKITAIHARKQERIARNTYTWGEFLKIVYKHNIKVYYSGVLQDLETPEGKLLAGILSDFNAYTIDKQSHLTKRSLRDNLEAGKAHGILAYGYMKDNNSMLVINEDEAAIVKKIFKLSLSGKGTNAIVQILNSENIPTQYNKFHGSIIKINKHTKKQTKIDKKDLGWSETTLRYILKNPIYKGKRRWNKRKVEGEWVYDYYPAPAIMEPEYWQKVNDNLKAGKLGRGKNTNHLYLLRTVIECGVCGRNMHGRKRKNRSLNYYVCSGKRTGKCDSKPINIDYVEQYIWGRLFEKGEVKDSYQMILQKDGRGEELDKLQKEQNLLSTSIEKLNKEKQNAVRLIIKGVISEQDAQGELKSIEAKLEDAQIKLSNLKEQESILQGAKETQKNLNRDIDSINTDIDFNSKKELIEKYIKRILIDYDFNGKFYILKINFNNSNLAPELHTIQSNYNLGISILSLEFYVLKGKLQTEKKSTQDFLNQSMVMFGK